MTKGSGKCLCGAVTFTAETVETHFHACHCGMCRRWSGGPGFGVVAEGLRFKGEENIVRYPSSDWADRAFCKRCGTGLFYYLKPADQYMMQVGVFDEPKDFTLASEIYIDHKPSGYEFAGDQPKKTEAEVIAEYSGGGGDT